MRRFTDRLGQRWDVVLGRESWGTLLALFVPAFATGSPVRQAALRSAGYDEAGRELDSMDDDALQTLLDESSVKEEGV
jgi:hypothetical protein